MSEPMQELVESEQTDNWQEQYPLNTFTGETQKELVQLITDLLAAKDDEWKQRIKNGIE